MNKVPTVKKMKLDESKYSIKCPYYRDPKGIVVHNTYNDAPAQNEVAYMQRRTDKVSFHAAIDDKEVVEGLPFERSCYASGDGENGDGNRNYLQFEICYSLSGGDKYKQAEENAVWYIAHVMNDYNFPMSTLKKHQDFSGKYCPHRILDEKRWESFVDRVRWCREQLKKEVGVSQMPVTNSDLTKEFKCGNYSDYVVTTDDLNIRKERNHTSEKMGTIPKGTKIKVEYILGVNNSRSEPFWGSVYTSYGNGFINLNYTTPTK